MMKTPERLYVDVHVLQTVPPSCINRDDTGSPKTAQYGGVTRARVSSQSWKRAARLMLKEQTCFDQNDLGYRTKALAQEVAKRIHVLDPEISEDAAEMLATEIINFAGKKPIISTNKKTAKQSDTSDDDESGDSQNKALFYITPRQINAVAKLAVVSRKEGVKPKKDDVQDALSMKKGIDIALFGRMVAQASELNVDACAQVAHSISTHKVNTEYDYFTAVDDLSPEDNTGAGHIGTVEYNSSTLYRYATIAVHELYNQLAASTVTATAEFVRAFVTSMPTGKQNTFANRTLPDAVMVTLRTDQPINLVGAFEEPVVTADGGYAAASARKLTDYAHNVYQDFAGEPSFTYTSGRMLDGVGTNLPFSQLLEQLTGELEARLTKGDDAL